jgi:hypothetical protein
VVDTTWRAAIRIVVGVEDLVQKIKDSRAQVGYSVAGRSGGRVTPCVVCTVHMEMRSTYFLVEPQNQGRQFLDLGIKTDGSGLLICASKSLRRFLDLALKIKRALVYRLRHKIDGGRLAWDTRRDLVACFA